jgi:hypothetical protein
MRKLRAGHWVREHTPLMSTTALAPHGAHLIAHVKP